MYLVSKNPVGIALTPTGLGEGSFLTGRTQRARSPSVGWQKGSQSKRQALGHLKVLNAGMSTQASCSLPEPQTQS